MAIPVNGDRLTTDLLVVGGGIAGMTAAIEASELGKSALIVEKDAFLGGRVARMNLYFPKMCPPTCGMEINVKRLERNPRVQVHGPGFSKILLGDDVVDEWDQYLDLMVGFMPFSGQTGAANGLAIVRPRRNPIQSIPSRIPSRGQC